MPTQRPSLPLLLALAVGGALHPQSSTSPRPEYEAKALVIRHLVNYITWPNAQDRPLHLGILGENPFGERSSLFLQGTTRIAYWHPTSLLRDLEGCDIVFICASESYRLPEILARLRGRPILTLSDTPGFAQRGVMINLVVVQDRITLEVNLVPLRQANLYLSSAVLSRAKVFDDR